MIPPIFLLGRHGRTAGNEKNLYRGWSNADFAQLDAAGRDDAREEGIFIQGTGLVFPIIITDTLDRTNETAQIVASILGIKEVVQDKRLGPIKMGDWTGKSKADYPLTAYMSDRSKRIPGGETMNEFDKRQSSVFADIAETVARIKKPVLVIGHGSNASYLYHKVNKGGQEVGYEGLTTPGGVSLFTKDGITPIFKKKEGSPQLYKQGTETSGFVTDEESRIPRVCWNCKWFVRDVNKLGTCRNPVVQIDPKLQERKQADNTIAVGDNDCCDLFANHIST